MSKSKYRGVRENPKHPRNLFSEAKWVASITYKGKTSNLIYTDDEEVAARAYDKFVKYYHKDKAKLNFPEE